MVHFDGLGRAVYVVSDYGGGTTAAVRAEADLTGRFSKRFDELGREVSGGFVAMAGIPVYGESAERGRRTTFSDARGALVRHGTNTGGAFAPSTTS